MERVLVVRTEWIRPFLRADGTIVDVDAVLDRIEKKHFFVERDLAEDDESLKQIIPYVCARFGERVLVLKRLKAQTEKRLHGMFSIGLGGHICEEDLDTHDNVVIAGMMRELSEEVRLDFCEQPRFLGVILDEESAVGRVHLGLAYEVICQSDAFEILETQKMSGSWEQLSDLDWDGLEGWSKKLARLLC